MNPKEPEFYAGILFWGETRAGETTTQFGWKFDELRVSYSYLLGSRRLIASAATGRLDVIAAPIAYLQRHAFELAVKEFIASAYEIKRDRAWLQQLRRDPSTAKPPALEEPKFIHRFDVLVDELRAALGTIDHEPRKLLVKLTEIGEQLSEVEQNKATYFRYGERKKPVTLELGVMQAKLEELFAEEAWIRDSEHLEELDTVYADICLEAQMLFQDICVIEQRHGMMKPGD
ncbi:MAG: hypothetical protein ACRBN8_46565 [Nannocystales bacterium]